MCSRLSGSGTLAIVAYKQPLSRAQIAAIRGVNVDGVMRTLQQRGYIEEVARDPGPGQAVLFGTTREFLARLGLDTIDDLPSVADLMPGADVVEALEQGLRAEPLTLPVTDDDDRADEAGDEANRADEARGEEDVEDDVTVSSGVESWTMRPTCPTPSRSRRGCASTRPPTPGSDVDEPDPSDVPSSTSVERTEPAAPRRGRGAAAEGPGPARLRQPAGLRGADRGRAGHGRTARSPSSGGGSTSSTTRSRSTARSSASGPGSSTTC